VGVNLGGGELLVAEHFLDITDVRSALQHSRGAGVPQRVDMMPVNRPPVADA
jgi:hypothetical protein